MLVTFCGPVINVDDYDEVKENSVKTQTTFTNYEHSMWTPLDPGLFLWYHFFKFCVIKACSGRELFRFGVIFIDVHGN